MPVTSQVPYKNYTAAPGSTVFATDFRVMFDSDLIVSVDSVVVTSGFTLSGVGDVDGAEVTFSSPMVGGELVELQRSIPLTRDTDYQQLGDFQSPVVNNDFDRIVMMVQDMRLSNAASVLLPLGDAQSPMTLPTVSERANLFLAFDAAGAAIAAAGSAGTPISSFMTTLVDDTDAGSARATLQVRTGSLPNFVNGGAMVAQRQAAATLTSTPTEGRCDNIGMWSTGTISAGTITRVTTALAGTTGYAARAAGVTLVGAAVLSSSIRMESRDALKYKGATASFQVKVDHDLGASLDYTLVVKKANAADDFSARTTIATSSPAAVATGTGVRLLFENVALGDCSNGLELEVQVSLPGGATTRNFNFTEFGIEPGPVATDWTARSYGDELQACRRYMLAYVASSTVSFLPGANPLVGSTTACGVVLAHPVQMLRPPTGAIGSASAHYTINQTSGGVVATGIAFADATRDATRVTFSTAGSLTVGGQAQVYANNASGYLYLTGAGLF